MCIGKLPIFENFFTLRPDGFFGSPSKNKVYLSSSLPIFGENWSQCQLRKKSRASAWKKSLTKDRALKNAAPNWPKSTLAPRRELNQKVNSFEKWEIFILEPIQLCFLGKRCLVQRIEIGHTLHFFSFCLTPFFQKILISATINWFFLPKSSNAFLVMMIS